MAEKQFGISIKIGEDPAVSEKEKQQRDTSLSTLSGCLAFTTPMMMGALWLTEALWTPLAIFFYLVMMGVSFAVVSDTLLAKNKKVPDAGAQALTLASIIVIVVAFSQVSRHYYLSYGGFEAASDNYWHWLRYGAEAVSNAILREVPEVWGWQITEIQPVAFWPRVGLVAFQLAADVLAIGGLWRFVQNHLGHRPKPPSEGSNYLHYMARGIPQVLGLALWGIPLAMGVDAMMHDGWNPASTWPAIRLAIPLVLGAWLVRRSIRALEIIPGPLNALGGALGLGAGVWLVWVNWAALRALV